MAFHTESSVSAAPDRQPDGVVNDSQAFISRHLREGDSMPPSDKPGDRDAFTLEGLTVLG